MVVAGIGWHGNAVKRLGHDKCCVLYQPPENVLPAKTGFADNVYEFGKAKDSVQFIQQDSACEKADSALFNPGQYLSRRSFPEQTGDNNVGIADNAFHFRPYSEWDS
jgi:hypothetical protein